ncbi:Imm70 family immunity protein [Parvimonas micra]|uniref:Imm70 family immunity protein n=1 Tax=Parvimonas micra TaxID=33033 RepID=UPI0030D620D2
MAVGLKIDFLWYSIGSPDFLHSFLSTICVNLENSNWGSSFPTLMKELYEGKLKHENIDSVIRELNEIELLFRKLGTDKVVWDIDNPKLTPPWGDNISPDIHNLSEYFLTSDGYNIFEIIREALEEGKKERIDVELKSI